MKRSFYQKLKIVLLSITLLSLFNLDSVLCKSLIQTENPFNSTGPLNSDLNVYTERSLESDKKKDDGDLSEKTPDKETKSREGGKKKLSEKKPVTGKSADEPGGEKLSEIEKLFTGQKDDNKISATLPQFGYDLFKKQITTFAPILNVPVGPDYIIGPGDGFTISIWGKLEAAYPVTVDRDGKIIIPEVGAVSVWGLKLSELNKVLKTEIAKYVTDFELDVTLRKLRTITVFAVGNVKTPGSYTVSSLSSMINALFACGGPTKNGSLRKIQLIRNGKVIRTLDLYDFLLKGDKNQDERIQQGDTIFVPLIGAVVGAAGNVKRPAIYEIKNKLVLGDMLELAGGVTPFGYLQRVQVERVEAHDRHVVVDLNLSSPSPEKENALLKTPLQDRDMVKIFSIFPKAENIVRLQGHLARPGDYEWKKGLKISGLIGSYAQLLPEPYMGYAELIRLEQPDRHEQVLPFNLEEMLKRNPEHDLILHKLDRIKVYSKLDFEDKNIVTIKGEIRKPGAYPLRGNMRISNLIRAAGYLTKDASLEKAEVFRLTPDRDVTTIPFNLRKALAGDKKEDLLLRNEDRVIIHNIWETKDKGTVSVIGQVRKTGDFELTESMRVSDLIFRAGGLKESAYLKEAELTRLAIRQEGIKTELMSINLEKVLEGDKEADLLLRKFDSLKVLIIPDWKLKRVVSILGEVKFPGNYNIAKEEKLSSLIKRAGGYSDHAYLKGSLFTRESVKKQQQKHLDMLINKQETEIEALSARISQGSLGKDNLESAKQSLELQKNLLKKLKNTEVSGRVVIKFSSLDKFRGSEFDLRLREGDTLNIPSMPDTVTVVGEVYNQTSLVYRKNKGVDYYLNKVGGTTENANDDEIYVIKADGTIISRSQVGFFSVNWDEGNNRWVAGGFMSIELDPGDSILVPRDLEKIDWLKGISQITQILYQMAIPVGVVANLL